MTAERVSMQLKMCMYSRRFTDRSTGGLAELPPSVPIVRRVSAARPKQGLSARIFSQFKAFPLLCDTPHRCTFFGVHSRMLTTPKTR